MNKFETLLKMQENEYRLFEIKESNIILNKIITNMKIKKLLDELLKMSKDIFDKHGITKESFDMANEKAEELKKKHDLPELLQFTAKFDGFLSAEPKEAEPKVSSDKPGVSSDKPKVLSDEPKVLSVEVVNEQKKAEPNAVTEAEVNAAVKEAVKLGEKLKGEKKLEEFNLWLAKLKVAANAKELKAVKDEARQFNRIPQSTLLTVAGGSVKGRGGTLKKLKRLKKKT